MGIQVVFNLLVGLRFCSDDFVEDQCWVDELFFFVKDFYEYVVVVDVVVVVLWFFCWMLDVLEKFLLIKMEMMWYLFSVIKGEFFDLFVIVLELVVVFYLMLVVCGILIDFVREVIFSIELFD